MGLIAKFVVSRCAFCIFWVFVFPQSSEGILRKYIFTCTSSKGHGLSLVIGGSCSVLFVSCYKACCFVTVLFWAIIDWLSLLCRFLWSFSFLSLSRIKQCLPPSFDKKSTHYRDFLRYSWAVGVILSQAGRACYIVICINLAFTKMHDWRTEKPRIRSKFAKHAAPYNKLCCKGFSVYVYVYV